LVAPCLAGEKKAKDMEKNFKDRVLSKIPYSEEMEYAWDIVDGDIDLLSVQGLRGDRRNKGLRYTTDSLPFIGSVDGMEFQFKAGDTNEFSFKSDVTPFVGRVDGLSYKAYTNTDNSAIYARYTISLD
jgi:hypothetical protein